MISGKTIDAHGHLTHHSRPDWQETDRKIIDTYDKLGITGLLLDTAARGGLPRRNRFGSAINGL